MGKSRIVSGRFVVLTCVSVCLVTACSDATEPEPPPDPCAERPIVAGGSVELGLNEPFTPIANGEDAKLVFGAQGLWMFVINARVRDMDPGSEDVGVLVDAVDASGEIASLFDRSCRARPIAPGSDGALQLTTGFLMPLKTELAPTLEGSTFTIRVEVRDTLGHRATDERTVVARM